MSVELEKITFKDYDYPAVGADSLNLMQQYTENGINDAIEEVEEVSDNKYQGKLVAGTNINIDEDTNTISATLTGGSMTPVELASANSFTSNIALSESPNNFEYIMVISYNSSASISTSILIPQIILYQKWCLTMRSGDFNYYVHATFTNGSLNVSVASSSAQNYITKIYGISRRK